MYIQKIKREKKKMLGRVSTTPYTNYCGPLMKISTFFIFNPKSETFDFLTFKTEVDLEE